MRARHGRESFSIGNAAAKLQAAAESRNAMTLMLGLIAAVSLLVGGIGVMNIMLVSVTERTREIGVRMAVGAREGDILLQFLIEAIALSSIGGLLGVALGMTVVPIVAFLKDLPMHTSPVWVVASVLFSGFVGVAFGFFPARRAARLDTIEALRRE